MLRRYWSFVRFEHTLFALPLVLAGAALAARGLPPWPVLALIVAAAAGARTCAMGLNRIIDAAIDARNPRTAGRELPAGALSFRQAWGVSAAGAAAYLLAAGFLSPLCLALSPIPLLVFAGYPYLKRHTALAHFGVGVADALGPAGAWVAVRSASGAPVLEDAGGLWWLSAFAVLWVAGFDVIYATLDEEFDRAEGLHSLPALTGRENALRVSGALHFLAAACLAFLQVSEFGAPYPMLFVALAAALLILEHERIDDVHFAFFTANAGISFLVLALVLAGVLLPEPS